MDKAEQERIEQLVDRTLAQVGGMEIEPGLGAPIDVESTVEEVLADERIVRMREEGGDGSK